jgi:hypothetical protein
MRPDEPFAGWDQNDPQTFNLYSYVRNRTGGPPFPPALNDEGCPILCGTSFVKQRVGKYNLSPWRKGYRGFLGAVISTSITCALVGES